MATAHFSDAELACKCGCGGLPPQEFQDRLEELRTVYAEPMVISSGYRCPDYNESVSSTGRTGPHTIAAVDVLTFGGKALRLVGTAYQMGWTGIGLKQHGNHAKRFVHLDRLNNPSRPTVWTYG